MAVDLRGRSALITGAGRGIGRAIALGLAAAGAHVTVTARTEPEVAALAAEVTAAGGQAGHAVCDAADRAQVEALVANLGPVDILVNNAGIAPAGPLLQLDEELWERTLRLNLTAPYRMTRLLLPGMLARGWGRIINIASTLARTAYPQTAAYTASKHGLLGLTRAVALEVAQSPITVNAVCPGYVDTPMTATSAQAIAERSGKSIEEALELLARSSPQRRLITVAEVTHVVLMLCAEAARGINGQALMIDGGTVLA